MPLKEYRDANGHKQCTTCKEFKDDFSYGIKDGRPSRKCKACLRELYRSYEVNRAKANELARDLPNYKHCSSCKLELPLSYFSYSKTGKFKTSPICKGCAKIANAKSRERVTSNTTLHSEVKEKAKIKYSNTKEYWVNWCERNRAKINAREAKRRASKLTATPSWANIETIEKIYIESKQISDITGILQHVDHIVPLVSKVVCGLHCEANLRIIPYSENISKGNRYWDDMPN